MKAMWSKRRILRWGIGLTVVGFAAIAVGRLSIHCTYDVRSMRLAVVQAAIEAYVADTERLPADLSVLSDAQPPYARVDSLRDGGGTPIGYEILDASTRRYRLTMPATLRSDGRQRPALSKVDAVPLEPKR